MKSDYEQRKQNRLEAYKHLAEKNKELSDKMYKRAKSMASVIPFGQPILIGHYSEKRDRNYRNKIHNTFGKSFELDKKSAYYKSKALTIETNNAISSDDPEAIQKLKEKLTSLQQMHEKMKVANKIVRSKKSNEEKIKMLRKILSSWKDEQLTEFLNPRKFGGPGFPSFSLTNSNQNINSVKKRIEYLERLNKDVTTEITIHDIKIVDNVEENRLQIFFPGKPDEEKRKELSHRGFHWTRSLGCWQRYRNPYEKRRTIELVQKWFAQ